MADQHHKEDHSLAQKICKHLKACRNDAILELYHDHHRFFLAFTRLRLFSPEHDQIEAVVSNFWMELLNGNAICSYQGKAALRTYLLTILNRRIIDANRRFQREMKYTEITEEQNIDSLNMPEDQRSAEDYVLQKERRKLIYDALIRIMRNSGQRHPQLPVKRSNHMMPHPKLTPSNPCLFQNRTRKRIKLLQHMW